MPRIFVRMNATHDIGTVTAILEDYGREISEAQGTCLERYVALLHEWNRKINLISRKDEGQIWRNHVLHSLAAPLLLPFPREGRIIDIGSGGGLPGIPLAILLPQTEFVLVDSIGKKIRAVEEIATELGVHNVTVEHARVEDDAFLRRHGGTAWIVTARAVTRLDALVRWAAPLLGRNAERRLIAWKGGDLTEEIAEARRHPLVHTVAETVMEIPGEPWFAAEEKKLVEVGFR
ncbi:MAG: 16S rRNA (guanine(527)-N(7))-methyltransferase RsmG [Bacteroidetes bacterium]|nr:16S rRNA (guanine(527)-N(7))-methyltransferase RsmG [Bacteroidota bacterium]